MPRSLSGLVPDNFAHHGGFLSLRFQLSIHDCVFQPLSFIRFGIDDPFLSNGDNLLYYAKIVNEFARSLNLVILENVHHDRN